MKSIQIAVVAVFTAVALTACPSVADTTQPTITTFTGNAAQLEVAASDTGGIQKVEFYRVAARKKAASQATTEQPVAPDLPSGDLLATDTEAPYRYTFTARDNGTFTYFAKAYDLAGNSTQSETASVTVNLADTTAPAVPTMTLNKTAFTAGEVLTATVSANDDTGVDRVELVLEGYGVLQTDTSAPYSLNETMVCADPTLVREPTAPVTQSKTLKAVASDAAGNSTASAAQTVTITCTPNAAVR
jgi:hypothetical protein